MRGRLLLAVALLAVGAVLGVRVQSALQGSPLGWLAAPDAGTWPESSDPRAVVTAEVPPPSAARAAELLRTGAPLAVVESAVETVVDRSGDRRLGAFPLGRTTVLFVARGRVTAAVDLTAVEEGDFLEEAGVLTIRLGEPRVLEAVFSAERSYTLDVQRSLLGPDAPELEAAAVRAAREEIVAAACADGLLESASRRAILVAETLARAAGYDDARAVVEGPGTCAAPPDEAGADRVPGQPGTEAGTAPATVQPGSRAGTSQVPGQPDEAGTALATAQPVTEAAPREPSDAGPPQRGATAPRGTSDRGRSAATGTPPPRTARPPYVTVTPAASPSPSATRSGVRSRR